MASVFRVSCKKQMPSGDKMRCFLMLKRMVHIVTTMLKRVSEINVNTDNKLTWNQSWSEGQLVLNSNEYSLTTCAVLYCPRCYFHPLSGLKVKYKP
jgi:hypothetical protein